MELHYEITEQDFVDYNLYFIAHDAMTQKTIRRMSTLTAALVLVGGTALMYLLDTLSPVSVGMYVVLAAVCFFGCPAWFTHKARKNVHRTIERASNRHICGPKTLRLTDTGVQLVGESEDSSYPYAAFQRVITAEKQVYLYLDDLSALIVPRCAFPDEEARRTFVRMLEGRITEAKMKKSRDEAAKEDETAR